MTTSKFSIIYQDHHLLIVNKPAGIVIHPTYKHADGTMWDALLAYTIEQGKDDWQPPELPDEAGWLAAPGEIRQMLREKRRERMWKEEGQLSRPALLHRLDKDTSGIVALARTERSRRHIIRQFLDHSIVKRYLAVVRKGAPDWAQPRTTFAVSNRIDKSKEIQVSLASLTLTPGKEYRLEGPLQRDPDDRRRCIVGPDGQEASTLVKVLNIEEAFILLEVHPITGRTHQIRAHLAALGYAIVGDQMYAESAESGTLQADLNRQFLHAHSLELNNYPTNERKTFVAPLAEDLIQWMVRAMPDSLGVIDANRLSS